VFNACKIEIKHSEETKKWDRVSIASGEDMTREVAGIMQLRAY
jgi:hypothetical protein